MGLPLLADGYLSSFYWLMGLTGCGHRAEFSACVLSYGNGLTSTQRESSWACIADFLYHRGSLTCCGPHAPLETGGPRPPTSRAGGAALRQAQRTWGPGARVSGVSGWGGAGGREAGVATPTLVPSAQVTWGHLLGVHLTSRLHPGRSPGGAEAKFNAVLRVGVREWAVAVDAGGGLSGGRGWWTRSPWAGPAPCCLLLLRTRDPLQGRIQVHLRNKNVRNRRLQASF